MKKVLAWVSVLFLFTFTAYSNFSLFPSSTPTPSNTPTLTATSTRTPLPTMTSTPTATLQPTVELPQGTPIASLRTIPIMPGAIAGDGDEQVYTYYLDVPQDDVVSYYLSVFEDQFGWPYNPDWNGLPGDYTAVLPNDRKGWIIYFSPNGFNYIFVWEEDGFTFVEMIYLNPVE